MQIKFPLIEAYDQLLSGKQKIMEYFGPDDIRKFEPAAADYHIVSGSFNPLHTGHKYLYDQAIGINRSRIAYYEISLTRVDKPVLSTEDLRTRLLQFNNKTPILITNSMLMLNKAGLFNINGAFANFHIGHDLIVRMLEDYGGVEGVQGIRANFTIYARGDNCKEDIEMLPYNCRYHNNVPDEIKSVSSTKIRETEL